MEQNLINYFANNVQDYLSNPDRYVYPFVIKEKNGKERTIITYNKSGSYGAALRKIHEGITNAFNNNFAERNANSFAYHKNIRCYDALQSHLKSNIFIKLDIHHFFESITEELFFSIYGEYFNSDWKEAIRGLFFKGSLSIGFVSSPLISDFFMKKFDKDIENYLVDHKELHYSRYSDDILLSSELDDDKSLNELYEFVKKELSLFKLEINEKKTRRVTLAFDKHNSISYLGLNISKEDYKNNKITISKRYILFLLFLIEKQRGYTDYCFQLDNEIKSRISYLAYNSPVSYQRFQKKHFNKYGEPYSFVPRELEKRSASPVVNEIPNFDEYSKLFKINIHKNVSGPKKQGFAIRDAIEIESYIGPSQEVVEIPYFVDSIGEHAFSRNNANGIKKIVLNEKLKNIADKAFMNLASLEEINLPESVRYIGEYAFRNCSNLKKIIIPSKIKTIQNSTFCECENLSEVVLSEGLEVIDAHAFYSSGVEELKLPSSLKEIRLGAFASCGKLENINLESSKLETIGSLAFSRCVKLKEAILPNTLLTLEARAFDKCSSLRRAYIPASTLEVGSLPFSNCPLLTSIEVDKNNKIYLHRDDNSSIIDNNGHLSFTIKKFVDSDVKSIGFGTFSGSFVKDLVIPEGVTSIEASAFENASWLRSISLPSSLKTIGNNAFAGCISLEKIVLPQAIKTISAKAFYGCTRLKTIEMPDEIISIGDYAFSNCASLELKFPKEVQTIGQYAYSGCINNKNLFIPAKVKQIKRDAFKGLNNVLETIEVDPLNTTFSSGDDANVIINVKKGIVLIGCKNSKIDQGIRTIGKYAFAYCGGLKSISLPNTVQHINKGAFIGCKSLAKVDLNHVNAIDAEAFKDCINLKEIELPNSLIGIGQEAFANTGLTSIQLPESLTMFGSSMFKGSSLEDIYLPATFTEDDVTNGALAGLNYLKHLKINPSNSSFDTSIECDALISKKGRLLVGTSSTKIGSNVSSIWAQAFSGNKVLEEITIPSTVESIDVATFKDCTNLKSAKVLGPARNISRGMFEGCINLEDVELQPTLIVISDKAFKNCYKLKKVDIASTVSTIGNDAFNGCKAIKSIILPADLLKIGSGAFSNMEIEEIVFPAGIKSVPSSCLANCSNLKTVKLSPACELIGSSAFSGCDKLESIQLPDEIAVIQNDCFKGCTSLKKINFPAKLTSIGAGAFKECPNLIIPDFPEELIEIGGSAFADNKTIHNIYLPSKLCAFSNSSFLNCEIESIKVSKQNPHFFGEDKNVVTYLDEDNNKHLLFGCKNSIIPDDIKFIDNCALYGVKKIKGFKLPNGLESIGLFAFNELTIDTNKLVFPNSLKTIANGSLNLEGISEVIFNEGIEKVDNLNFKGVKKIHLPASIKVFDGSSFDDDVIFDVDTNNQIFSSYDGALIKNNMLVVTNKNTKLPVEGTCKGIGSSSYNGRSFDIVEIPEGVVSLEGFSNCQINELRLPKSLERIGCFAFNTSIKKIVVARDNPYFCTDEKGLRLFNISKSKIYYCGDEAIIPEGISSIVWGAINRSGISKLFIPSTYLANDFDINPHLFKEVKVAKDNPQYESIDNCVIRTSTKTLMFALDPVKIPDVVTNIAPRAFNMIGKPFTTIYIPKNVIFISKFAFNNYKLPGNIVVDKDNSIFDSRDNCGSIIVTKKNALIVKSQSTKVPNGVIDCCDIDVRIENTLESAFQSVYKTNPFQSKFADDSMPF